MRCVGVVRFTLQRGLKTTGARQYIAVICTGPDAQPWLKIQQKAESGTQCFITVIGTILIRIINDEGPRGKLDRAIIIQQN